MTSPDDRDALAISTLRFLAVDMVERAKSGHPGAPLGQAPLCASTPGDPDWPDRDRFVLSAGTPRRCSTALLHLTGYDLPLDELRASGSGARRRPDTRARAHPGVETTTGPLGQGISTNASAWRSPSACWRRASTGRAADRRPPHLGAVLRTAT
jgi:transketolase